MQGKYGLALIGNDSLKAYELIVYKDKQNILIRAKLQAAFTYTLHKDNFASFSDDQSQMYFVRFDNAKDYTDFCAELERRKVKVVENKEKSGELDGNKEDEVPETQGQQQEQPHIDNVVKTDKVDGDQSDSSGNQMKANILSRMAKMGQPIFPVPTQTSMSDYADSDSDASNISRKSRKSKRVEKPPVASNKPEPSKLKQLNLVSTSSPLHIANSNSQYLPNSNVQMVPLQSALPQYQAQPGQMVLSQIMSPTVDPLNLLLAENRTHNCEIRMNISQLSNKMDEVLKKIEHGEKESAEERLLRTKVKALELKAANLTKELEESINANIEVQKKVLESKRSDPGNWEEELKEKDRVLQKQSQRIEELERQLRESKMKNISLENENEGFKRSEVLAGDISVSLEGSDFGPDDFEKIYNENKDNETFLKTVYQTLFQELYKFKQKSGKIEEAKANNAKVKHFTEKLEAVMQDFQQYIYKHFDSTNNTFPADFLTKLLPKSTKTAANYLVKEFEKDFKINQEDSVVFKPEGTVSELSD